MSPNPQVNDAPSAAPWTLRPENAPDVLWVLNVYAGPLVDRLKKQAQCPWGCQKEELANVTWMRACESYEKYDPSLADVGGWLNNLMQYVCGDAHRGRGRRGRYELVSHADLSEFPQRDDLDPEREAGLREGLGYVVEGLDGRAMRIVLADELESGRAEELADALGISVETLYTIRQRTRARLRPRREHVFSLLPLLLVRGAEGRSARQGLWAWITTGWRAVSMGAAALALTAGGAFHLGERSGRRAPRETRAAVVAVRPEVVATRPAVVAPVPRPEAVPVPTVAATALPAAMRVPTVAGVDPATPSVSRPSRAESARAARVLLNEADGLLDAHPDAALRRAEQAGRVAPRVDGDRRESLRCLALGRLHRDVEAATCARDFQRLWPRSPLASQVAALRPSSAP